MILSKNGSLTGRLVFNLTSHKLNKGHEMEDTIIRATEHNDLILIFLHKATTPLANPFRRLIRGFTLFAFRLLGTPSSISRCQGNGQKREIDVRYHAIGRFGWRMFQIPALFAFTKK